VRAGALIPVALVAAAVLALGGCGGKAATEDTAPFGRAIADYLKDKNMDMQVTEFRSLEVRGDAGTAVCKLEPKGDLYGGVGVRWEFTFAREGDAWKVTEHRKL
jgi:hypothetical protein